MKKLIEWFKQSNRWKHLIGGILVYIILLVMALIKIPISIVMAIAVLIVMMAMEFKDKATGGMWDWLDILAGVICPLIIGLILCLIL